MGGRMIVLALGVLALLSSFFIIWAIWHYERLAVDVAWIDDRHFEALTLVTVGTGSTYENPSRLGPVSAVGFGDEIVLVDAGRGVAEALRRCEIRPAQPLTVVLTSLLPENTLGLDDLLVAGWLAGRESPLRVLGPPGTAALAGALREAHAPSLEALEAAIGLPAGGARFDARDVEDGFAAQHGGLAMRARRVASHPLESLAWRFESDRRALVVAGSGPGADALADFAQNAGLLAVEGFLRDVVDQIAEAGDPDAEKLLREADLHLSLREAGSVAERAGVPLLVLTRLRPPPLFDQQFRSPVAERFSGRTVIADECDEFGGRR